MIDASNSDNGIGLSQNDAASHISGLLDSNLDIAATVETGDVENETDEVSLPSEDAIETTDEQTLEDSDEQVEAEDDAAAEAEVTPIQISDDAVFELDGEKITGKQWKEANLRYADYTQKTQALAAERKKYDAGIDVIRDQSLQFLYNMEREFTAHLPKEPDWAQLSEDNPVEYVRQVEVWRGIHAQKQQIRNEIAATEKQKAEREEVVFQQTLAEGQRQLHEWHPELAKPETGTQKSLWNYIVNAGIPAEAVNRETNPILFSMAYKAMQFDQLQAQKAKAVKVVDEKPLLATPGSSPARSSSSQSVVERKMSALKKSGSVNDAADVLKHLL